MNTRRFARWIILAGPLALNAQTGAYFYRDSTLQTRYQLTEARDHTGYFPAFGDYPEYRSAYAVPSSLDGELFQFEFDLPTTPPDAAPTLLLLHFASTGIRQLSLEVVLAADSSWHYAQPIAFDGMQTPLEIGLPTATAARVRLQWIRDSTAPAAAVAIADLRVIQRTEVRRLSPLPFFGQLFASNRAESAQPRAREVQPFYAYYPANFIADYFPVKIELTSAALPATALLDTLLEAVLTAYRFYPERGLDRAATLVAFAALRARFESPGADPCERLTAYAEFIDRTFQDGHFFLRHPCDTTQWSLGPLRLYSLDGRLSVAANFDPAALPVGSIVLAIDGVATGDGYARGTYDGDLLRRPVGSRVTIDYLTPAGERRSQTLVYGSRYPIPANFRPSQLELRDVAPGIATFRLGNFRHETYTWWAAVLPKLNTYRGIVIDLRGNGGGDATHGAKMISHLIDRPLTWVYLDQVETGRPDSIVVAPDPLPHLRADLPIAVLTDERTACAAEIFLNGLRHARPNVRIFGTTTTAGALAPIQQVEIASLGVTVGIATSIPFHYWLPGFREGRGFAPDEVVHLTKIADLRPYDDLLLRSAVAYLTKSEIIASGK